jgi:hypothetical protein
MDNRQSLLGELRSFVFPDCGLHHEQLRTEVLQSQVLLPVINSSHLNTLCSADVKLCRPACPHFNDARQGSDPIEKALLFLGERRGISCKKEIDGYRELRVHLRSIDHCIRATRKHLHNLQCPGTYADIAVLCEHIKNDFRRHAAGVLPRTLENVSDMEGMEQALLAVHAEIRQALRSLVQSLIADLESCCKQ